MKINSISITAADLRMNRLLLLIAMLGALLMSVSDALLLGNPVSGGRSFMLDAHNMISVPYERLVWGGLLGVLAGGPLEVAGYVALYRITRTHGGYQPLIMSAVFIYMVITAVATRTAYVYTGIALKMDVADGSTESAEVIFLQQNILRIILVLFAGSTLLLGSVLYMMLVAKGPTTLHKWMLVVNPLSLSVLVAMIALFLPAPAGGFIAMPAFNIAQLIFFAALFIHIKRLKPGIWTDANAVQSPFHES